MAADLVHKQIDRESVAALAGIELPSEQTQHMRHARMSPYGTSSHSRMPSAYTPGPSYGALGRASRTVATHPG